MVNGRLCKTARQAFFFASPRHFDFLDCETETSKSFEFEREKFETLKIQAADLLDSKNELVQPFYLAVL